MAQPDVPPPFPRWIQKRDTFLSSAGDNGLFCAFYLRRRRSHSLVSYSFAKALSLGVTLMWVMLGMIIAAGLLYFLGPCFGGLLALAQVAGLIWLSHSLRFRRSNLPYWLEQWVLGDPRGATGDELRLLPLTSSEIGEALLIEELERRWGGRYAGYWLVIAAAAVAVVAYGWPVGAGDLALVAAVIAGGIFWSPAYFFTMAQRIGDRLVERVVSEYESSPLDRGAWTFIRTVVLVFYYPIILGFLLAEVLIAYLLLSMGLEVAFGVMFYSEASPDGQAAQVVSEMAHGAIAVLVLASFPLARSLARSAVEKWRLKSRECALRIGRMAWSLVQSED